MEKRKHRVLLVILDGWGHSEEKHFNAIDSANTPNWDKLLEKHPNSLLKCSGTEVGLPRAQMGNSEVGHMHLGAGRLISQDLSRINNCLSGNGFESITRLTQELELVANNRSAVHLLGLLSPGGVHSHTDHLEGLIRVAQEKKIDQIYIHGFLDGRDTAPKSAADYISRLEAICNKTNNVKIASIIGRYYAMDRNNNWDRIKSAHDLITLNDSKYEASSALEGLYAGYARGETDEFLQSTSICCNETKSTVKDTDLGVFINFRSDRARQLTTSLTAKHFSKFDRGKGSYFKKFITMTDYGDKFSLPVLFPQQIIKETLGQIVSEKKLGQIRIAETEKYAHVTFFFNGGREQAYPGEDRILIPSPDVATYDRKPEMSALKVCDAICKSLRNDDHDVIISNFANADMVGHTGVFSAAVKAVETIDHCLGIIAETAKKHNVDLLITADHGNAENMCEYPKRTTEKYSPHTAHTNNLVPFVYLGNSKCSINDGELKDVAPTMLQLLEIDRPPSMTGKPLLRSSESSKKI